MHKSFIGKFTKKKPIVIYNPIDYQPLEKVTNNIPHIGFLASLLARKGCDLMIKALSQIREKERTCTIVGDGDQRNSLQGLVKSLGLTDRILFVGADDRTNWLHKFDIFVNPSYQEGLPTTVVEALLAKCVVVATNVGGTKEISDKNDLILVKRGDHKLIAQGIQGALNKLAESGKSYSEIKEKFGVKSAIERYRKILIPKKKKIIFVAPIHKGGTYYFYQGVCTYLQFNYSDQYEIDFYSSLKEYLYTYIKRSDVVFSIIPFLFKPLFTKKYIFNPHGNFQIERKNKGVGNKLLYLSELNLWFCDRIMLNSYFIADKLGFRKKYNKKITLVHNYINTNIDTIKERDPTPKIINNEKEINLLTISSANFLEKGIGVYDLAKEIFSIDNLDIYRKIILPGNKKNKKIIIDKIHSLDKSKRVKIMVLDHIPMENLDEYYNWCDVFVYGTRLDTRGAVIMEACAHRKPIMLLPYELREYIYPASFVYDDFNKGLHTIIQNYELKAKESIKILDTYSIEKTITSINNLID